MIFRFLMWGSSRFLLKLLIYYKCFSVQLEM